MSAPPPANRSSIFDALFVEAVPILTDCYEGQKYTVLESATDGAAALVALNAARCRKMLPTLNLDDSTRGGLAIACQDALIFVLYMLGSMADDPKLRERIQSLNREFTFRFGLAGGGEQ